MLLYERPVYNEKLQQDIDLEGRGAERPVFKGGGATSSETRLYSAFTDRYQEWLLRCRSRAARKRPVTVWAEYLPLRHESFEFPPNDWRPLNLLATDSASGQAE